MGQIIERPSRIRQKFWDIYIENKKYATDYYYKLSRQSNYIRTDRIAKNISFEYESNYGPLDITINLSKPEKDPKEIALAKSRPLSKYPQSMLAKENEGYSGRINYPARQNHRVIAIELSGEKWFFQYSPYTYYNEHSIVFSNEVSPMVINKKTFTNLIDFIELFPHYFVGSNADLPIVGGSILTHNHFQAGRYVFAMEVAPKTKIRELDSVEISIVKWPMTVIRLNSKDKNKIINMADIILKKWINYSDEIIKSHTDGVRHNTIIPIARFDEDGRYELDLVLRNNLTNEEYPFGVYHSHVENHNIKKENIGLIEVMGLAVFPARLKEEMKELEILIKESKSINELVSKMEEKEILVKHINWVKRYINDKNIRKIKVNDMLGDTFEKVLENCAVLDEKRLKKFIEEI